MDLRRIGSTKDESGATRALKDGHTSTSGGSSQYSGEKEKRKVTHMKFIGAFLMVYGVVSAQNQNENATRMAAGATPIYRVTVTARTAKAVNYQHRSGATKIDFKGTELLPGARGEAKVESKQGYIEIEVEFDGLQPATKNGAEYLTYVMWAVTPEGRTANLGEVLLNGTKSKLNVTTDFQVFGLLVTAEPYYAVTRPSDLIVMENVVRADTRGKIEEIDAKYELLQRGQYARLSNPLALRLDRKVPLELYEARNAVQIALAMGADRFATETFQKAEKSLAQAEAYQARNAGSKPVTMTAREAVQTAEDARAIAVKRQEEEALTAERQRSVEREARAESGRAAALSETDRVTREAEAARLRAQAESERLTRDSERLAREKDAQTAAALAEADRVKRDSEARTAAAGIEADRLKLENEARAAVAKNEADRLRLESDSRLAAAGAEADRLKRENEAQREANRLELDNAARQKAQLEAEKAELRTRLLTQFNAILQTRDTARGLIVNMSDVLFDTGKYSLRPLAREKLAKVAGIVSGHPGLRLDVEGHTDSVGGDSYNQQLSEQRAASVRDYLTQQGMLSSSVTAKGFGKTQPVASNDTAQGKQQNRRVELVISGEVIGSAIGSTIVVR
jgi:outer membrane protein OmpA-like peptidoglycan-associated protein